VSWLISKINSGMEIMFEKTTYRLDYLFRFRIWSFQ